MLTSEQYQVNDHSNKKAVMGDVVEEQEQERNPWLVLLVLCTAIFMLLLDTTIVNVAQRRIQVDLNASLTQIQWVLDSYILTYAVLLLSFGRMGDVFGRKRLFIVGMAIFTGASALCAASGALGEVLDVSGINVLIWARVLQGFGGAFMMPQTLSLLTVVFPPEKRGAAMGIWGGIVALGAVVGPVVGGLIVTNYAWEWVFLINLPIGIASIWATVALSTVGAVLIAIFIWWERRARDPMMKIELFAHRNFWAGNLVSLMVAFGMLGIFFPMTLFLQGALGFTPIRAGLTMTPMSLMIMVPAPIAGRLTDRIGARWILATGLTLMTTGVVFITSRISLETDWQRLLPALIVTGTGMGLTFAPMTTAVMAEVPPRIAGSASGILNTMRNIGQVMGIAVLGSVLSSRVAAHTGDQLDGVAISEPAREEVVRIARDSRFEDIAGALQGADAAHFQATFLAVQQAFVESLQNTFLVGAAACAVALGVALLMHNPARQPAKVTARRRETSATPAAAD
jgi:MFS family permease